MAWCRYVALLAGALLVSTAAAGFYGEESGVLNLSQDNFDQAILSTPGVAVVEFYAPWCGHCQALTPHYKKAAQNMQGLATVAAVDCDDQANSKLCSRYKIQGFPTIKLFGPDMQKNPYTGKLSKEAQDYMGGRTATAIVDATLALLTDVHVAKPKDKAALEAFRQANPDKPKVVLLSEKKEVATLYKALSTQMHDGMDFAQVHGPSMSGAAILLGLPEDTTLPALAVIKPGGAVERYDGPLKAVQLRAWLLQYAPQLDASDSSSTGSDASKTKAKAAGVELKAMTVSELQQLDKQEDIWLLALQWTPAGSDGSCEAQTKRLQEALAELEAVVHLGIVNISTPEELQQMSRYGAEVASLQQADKCDQRLVLLPFGADKDELEDYQVYNGELNSKAFYKWVTSHIPDQFTMEVTGSNLQAFATSARPSASTEDDDEEDAAVPLVEGVGHVPPKVILFTNKDEVPGLYKALAMNLRARMPGMLFGWVQANKASSKAVIDQLKPAKVPGVLTLFPVPKEMDGPDGKKVMGVQMAAQAYLGPIKAKALSDWLQQLITVMETMSGGKLGANIPELQDDKDLEAHCISKGGGVCVIGLADGSSKKSQKVVTKALGQLAAQRPDQPLHFSWLDGSKYRAFSSGLGALSSDLPTVAVLSAKRMRAALMPEPLSGGPEAEAALRKFVDGVLSGKVRTTPLDALPKVAESPIGASAEPTPADDDAAATEEPAVVEEEFDLSDVLNEEVEGSDVLLSKEERLKQVEDELRKQAEEEAARQKKSSKKKKRSKKGKKGSKHEHDASEL